MNNLVLWIALGIYAVSLVIFAHSLWRAPQGYEDRRGFHFIKGARPPLRGHRRRTKSATCV